MKRRDMLMALGLAGIGAAFAPVRAMAGLMAGTAPLSPRDLVLTLGQPASAVRIGRACLAERGAEGTAGELAALIERSLDGAPRGRHALRAALRQRMRDDFAAGSTVRVQGWVLSRTEVRLFTLAAQAAPAV